MLTWWWREFGRVSYLGGREYHRPQLLSVEFEYPGAPNRNSDGQVITTSIVPPQTSTLSYNSLLFRHEREQSWEFENRRKRAYYCNYVRSIVNSLVSHSMARAPTREGDDGLKKFWDGVDPTRTKSMDKFMETGLQQASVQGIMWCCTDVDPDDKTNPYSYWVSPLDILDWEVDEDGEIVWLKQFCYTEAERTWKEGVTPRYRFRIWTRKDVTTYETSPTGSDLKDLGTVTHPVGRVPFDPLYSLRTDEKLFPDGTALAIDLCKCANAIYNFTSLLSEILYKQTFSWLAIPDKNADVVQMGVNTAFGYDPAGTSAVPTYLSPDPEQARVIMESINAAVEQSRQSFGVGRGRAESSMSPTSGETAQLESADKRSILGDIAGEAQDFERRHAETVLAYRSQGAVSQTKPTIRYADDFDVGSLQSEINEALAMVKLTLSPQVKLATVSNIVRRKFASMNAGDLDDLVDTLNPAYGLDENGELLPPGKAAPGTDPNAPADTNAPKPPFGGKPGGPAVNVTVTHGTPPKPPQ